MVKFNPAPAVRKANTRERNAIAELTREHEVLRRLFRDYKQLVECEGDNARKAEAVGKICFSWLTHIQLEEEFIYPAARALLGATAQYQHALHDHAGSRELVAMLDEHEPGDADFDATVAVLAEWVLPHMDEEENNLFRECLLHGMEVDLMGRAIALRRKELSCDITLSNPYLPSVALAYARPDAKLTAAFP